MSSPHPDYVKVALPVPLPQSFTYSVPACGTALLGARVLVPFGARSLVGVVVEVDSVPSTEFKVRALKQILDDTAIVSASLFSVIQWASDYYHHPLGEVWQAALPKQARQAKPLTDPDDRPVYTLADPAMDGDSLAGHLSRAPAQRRLAQAIAAAEAGLDAIRLADISANWRAALRQLQDKALVVETRQIKVPSASPSEQEPIRLLNDEQTVAVEGILSKLDRFHTTLLNGVTGSGKTEVYFALIDAILAKQQQALVLFPEIALTTQLVARFERRFGSNIATLHSGLSDNARYQAWWRAKHGRVGIVLGTRSAVFTPLAALGLIIIDEEHDASFKQQEGFRYHARSVAIKRAQVETVPVVLGSATPSLETLHNVEQGRFSQENLNQRAGKAELPQIEFIDLQQYPVSDGLSQPILRAIEAHLDRQQQVLVFINRRGFSPVLFCAACQWQAPCPRCDTTMTLHRRRGQLRCHHCDTRRNLPEVCPSCGEDSLIPLGEGSQRIEETLLTHFPAARIQRFDRDELASQAKLEAALDAVHDHQVDILVGTQLLTKGHDFPNVTLVCVVNADSGLHSIDFRAPEQLIQQLMQVAGRAGRAHLSGQVLIQTHHPQHSYFNALSQHHYPAFATQALVEREMAGMPPYAHLALWRANSTRADASLQFLKQLGQIGKRLASKGIDVFDAVDSPMPKRGGRYRAQLLVRATQRRALHQLLASWIAEVDQLPASKTLRWSIDVDPIDLY